MLITATQLLQVSSLSTKDLQQLLEKARYKTAKLIESSEFVGIINDGVFIFEVKNYDDTKNEVCVGFDVNGKMCADFW